MRQGIHSPATQSAPLATATHAASQSHEWDSLQKSFAQLYQLTSSDQREYELHKAAQSFDIPVDVYRQLFNNYSQAQMVAGSKRAVSVLWRSPQKAMKLVSDVLTRLGWLSMVGVAITLSLQLVEVWEREEYLSWAIVSLNQGKSANGGRSLALSTLALMDSNLTGLNIEAAVLPELSLGGTNLLQANFKGASLPGADLSRTNLTKADLSGVDLSQGNIRQANLDQANLTGAQLYQSNLQGADLRYANLQDANLSGADLQGAKNLEQATLRGSIYDVNTQFPEDFQLEQSGAILVTTNADLSDRNLQGTILTGTDLTGANLSGANLKGATLIDTQLNGANLAGTNLRKVVGLTPNQVKSAQNWALAEYDAVFRQELGL